MSKKKPQSQPRTLVTFLLDRSASMSGCLESTIEAFNGYLDGIAGTDTIDFTLVQFDYHGWKMDLNKVCVAVPAKTVVKLDKESYQPRGSTPLIDAAYTVIEAVEKSLAEKPKDTRVVVCIQTDGQENCSSRYNWEQLNSLIKEKQDKGWQFNFMGAGIDAYHQGAKMGISPQATMSYDHTDLGATRAAYASRGAATMSFASGASSNMNISDLERQAAGDRFYKTNPKVVQPVVHSAGGFALDLSTTVSPPKKEEDFSL